MQPVIISRYIEMVLHLFGRHLWLLKGFAVREASCAFVWHCQRCATSLVRVPFDDTYMIAGYVPFSLEWEATRDNQGGAESGGRGVYVLDKNKMVKKVA